MRIDLLDMGNTKYGDCILVRHGNRSILIDGAHPGDTIEIRRQLGDLLGHLPPFQIDLLIVTHCHSDHIGCLPKLVGNGDLVVKKALVADERFGWGRGADDQSPMDRAGLTDSQRMLVAALQEEDYSDLPQDELEDFLEQDVTLEDSYIDMLEELADNGTTVIRYGRSAETKVRALETQFKDFGLKVLGPTKSHLQLCADAIEAGTDAIVEAVAGMSMAADADATGLAEIYRGLMRGGSDVAGLGADSGGVGAAKNDQSIVIKVGRDGWKALLGGDMQLALPQISGLDDRMADLRQKIVQEGPYDFIKFTHHSSDNAVDDSVLDEWQPTKLFAHTGGKNDPGHPDTAVLAILKRRGDNLKFARTDRNGIITVMKKNGAVRLQISKGRLNNFTANPAHDEPECRALVKVHEAPFVTSKMGAKGDGSFVDVHARVPHRSTKVTFTIQVEPGATGAVSEDSRALGDSYALGGGRPLPKLLFVTSRPKLIDNIGRLEAERVFRSLERAGARILDLPANTTTAEQAARIVREKLDQDLAGVVLLGGYDVVPSQALDVLDAPARRKLEAEGRADDDADNFIVWSDELYGDRDNDAIPELPVSRIPDGRKAEVVEAALQAPSFASGARFGVRNIQRPFAHQVFPQVPGRNGNLEISEMFAPTDITGGAAAGAVYLMLHGSARDATRFWGETQGGSAYEAIAIENVPEKAPGSVVFTGCCWGALIMAPAASKASAATPLRPRGPEGSMAIAYLKAGAQAFVGCTGSHYSPLEEPYNYYGRPMHDAFWAEIGRGSRPAEALFKAKKEYVKGMPHGMTDRFSQAVEMKILRQFTCLGLGW